MAGPIKSCNGRGKVGEIASRVLQFEFASPACLTEEISKNESDYLMRQRSLLLNVE